MVGTGEIILYNAILSEGLRNSLGGVWILVTWIFFMYGFFCFGWGGGGVINFHHYSFPIHVGYCIY